LKPCLSTLTASDTDQRLLLHDIADRLDAVTDELPLPDQLGPDPAIGEILEDDVRNLARLFVYLAGEKALRHRDTANYPREAAPGRRRITLALAQAAQPTGAALAALGEAVHHFSQLCDLTRPSSPRSPARAAAERALVESVAAARAHLVRAAHQLRTTANSQPPSATPAPAPAKITPTGRRR
jgi:hypothetical protein